MYLDAVCSENGSSSLSENVGLDSAVVSDSNGRIGRESFLNIVSKTLSCTSDSVDVHSVSACANNAAKSACAEFEVTVESVLDSFIVACNGFKFSLEVGVVNSLFAPEFIKFFFVHNISPHKKC